MYRSSFDFLIASSSLFFVRLLVFGMEGLEWETWISCILWTAALGCSLMVFREVALRLRGGIVEGRVVVLDSLVLEGSVFLPAPVFVLEMLLDSIAWEPSTSWLVVWERID